MVLSPVPLRLLFRLSLSVVPYKSSRPGKPPQRRNSVCIHHQNHNAIPVERQRYDVNPQRGIKRYNPQYGKQRFVSHVFADKLHPSGGNIINHPEFSSDPIGYDHNPDT